MSAPSFTSPASLANQSKADPPSVRINVPSILTIVEAAALLTISKRKAADLLASGRLKSIRIGRRRVVRRCDLEQLLGCALS